VIVDTSVLIAILRAEPRAATYAEVLGEAAGTAVGSAATVVEAGLVAGPDRSDLLDELIVASGLTVVPFDAAQARLARQAHREFGRGSGSPARLNLGDCFSYALATSRDEPLLFQGDDFTHTDLTPAVAGS